MGPATDHMFYAARHLGADLWLGLSIFATFVVYLGGIRLIEVLSLRAPILGASREDREAVFLQQFTGSRDNAVGGTPHLVGNTSPPPSLQRSSDGAARHAAVSRPLYSLQGYTPAPIHDGPDDLPPADRRLRGVA